MTANIRMQLTEAERREANASAAFRLAVAMPDPVETVADAIATLDDPKHILTHVAYLARRENYSDAATRLGLIPIISGHEPRLVETILNFEEDNICTFRIMLDLKVIRHVNNNRTLPKFEFADLVALAEGKSKKAQRAWVAIHALGFVRAARGGVIAIETTSDERPGLWPAAPAERVALAFNLIVRTVHGAHFDSDSIRWAIR